MSLHDRILDMLDGRIEAIGGEELPQYARPAEVAVKNYLTKKQIKALKALVRNLPSKIPIEMLEHMMPLFAIIDDGGDPYLREARYQLGIIMRPELQAKISAKKLLKGSGPRKESAKKLLKGSGPRKESAWVKHVKKVQAEKGISYKDAMKVASLTYNKK